MGNEQTPQMRPNDQPATPGDSHDCAAKVDSDLLLPLDPKHDEDRKTLVAAVLAQMLEQSNFGLGA